MKPPSRKLPIWGSPPPDSDHCGGKKRDLPPYLAPGLERVETLQFSMKRKGHLLPNWIGKIANPFLTSATIRRTEGTHEGARIEQFG